jgi:hypothetical protein
MNINDIKNLPDNTPLSAIMKRGLLPSKIRHVLEWQFSMFGKKEGVNRDGEVATIIDAKKLFASSEIMRMPNFGRKSQRLALDIFGVKTVDMRQTLTASIKQHLIAAGWIVEMEIIGRIVVKRDGARFVIIVH